MFKKLLLATVLAVPAVSMANGLSYSNIEASYQSLDVDGAGGEADGFGIGGSYLIAPTVFVAADYSSLSFDGGGDLDIGNLGLGMRYALNDTIDAIASAGLVSAKATGGDSEIGYRLLGGVRAALGQAELNGSVAFRDVDTFDDSQVIFSVGGVYNFTANIAAVAGAEFESDYSAFKIGGRYNF